MSNLTLIIGNKNYSSWSFRPWLLLKEKNINFTEVFIPIATEHSAEEIGKYSPAKKVPILKDYDEEITIWDSLAISEYIAEKFPEKNIFPTDKKLKAECRSIISELHSGFQNVRKAFPLNVRKIIEPFPLTNETHTDIKRIFEIFTTALKNSQSEKFLFGEFSIADSFYAPILSRFKTYQIAIPKNLQFYFDNIYELESFKKWEKLAKEETEIIKKFEL